MKKKDVRPDKVIAGWMTIPDELRKVVRGLPSSRLNERAGPDRMSIRETVHHVVEANLVAGNIILAALAKSDIRFDWTWVQPGGDWIQRHGYDRAPVAPAIATLRALGRHFAAVLSVLPDGLDRTVQLNDAPGAAWYTKTVGEILSDEVSHAREHLEELPKPRTRAATGRSRPRR
jgi:hypothetical protein